MAQKEVLAVVLVIAAMAAAASAQTGCTSVLFSLAPCLGFIQGTSSTPSSSCCTQLASIVKSQPQCLCQVLGGNAPSIGISINRTQALALPGACNVQTPPVSECNAAGGSTPPSSPSSPTSPSPSSPSTPSTSASPGPQSSSSPSLSAPPTAITGGRTQSTTSSTEGSSAGRMALSIFFLLLVASHFYPGFF
uniref:Non-specific lipid-transfer protein-like protein At2g13820 n=1 Tax=Anthurium amnicola TaxID=1678845 RepID=A0A1D1Y5P3_9ARAE